jgi:tRNA threonylcarbamoyladenosine biosynthesis protein TsaB
MIISIETSSSLCAVAFWENGKTFASFSSEKPMQHATLIGQFVEKGLQQTGQLPKLLAVAIGPGSFTGLRIGLSYAQGFCFGRNIPIVGVSNHQVLALQKTNSTLSLYTIIDARRDEVYLAKHKNNETFEIESHQIVALTDLAKTITAPAQIVSLPGLKITDGIKSNLLDAGIELNPTGKYSAAALAQIGQKLVEKRGSDNLETLEPMYIRPFAGVQ